MRAESEIRTRDAHESGRSRARTIAKTPLARCRSTSRGANTGEISQLSSERSRRIHRYQRGRCELENRVVERSGGGVSSDEATGDYRKQWGGERYAGLDRLSFYQSCG